jgi:hypothetical protein
MAASTPCQTDGATYGIKIGADTVMCLIELPFQFDLDEAETSLLKTNIHNAMELVLARYFVRALREGPGKHAASAPEDLGERGETAGQESWSTRGRALREDT